MTPTSTNIIHVSSIVIMIILTLLPDFRVAIKPTACSFIMTNFLIYPHLPRIITVRSPRSFRLTRQQVLFVKTLKLLLFFHPLNLSIVPRHRLTGIHRSYFYRSYLSLHHLVLVCMCVDFILSVLIISIMILIRISEISPPFHLSPYVLTLLIPPLPPSSSSMDFCMVLYIYLFFSFLLANTCVHPVVLCPAV